MGMLLAFSIGVVYDRTTKLHLSDNSFAVPLLCRPIGTHTHAQTHIRTITHASIPGWRVALRHASEGQSQRASKETYLVSWVCKLIVRLVLTVVFD